MQSSSDKMLALPISETFYQLALTAIPEHSISNKWKEFLFNVTNGSNTFVTEGYLVKEWRKWLSRSRLYNNMNRGRANYNNTLIRPKVSISVTVDDHTLIKTAMFDESTEASKALEKYNYAQLVALGYDPVTGYRKEWSN